MEQPQKEAPPTGEMWEAVVIGSGFGGAVSCCRMAQKWGGQVLLLERGKRYPIGSFPRSPRQMADNFWNDPRSTHRRPRHVRNRRLHGLYDIRAYDKIDTVVGAGLGGGSLIYANVFLEPPETVFQGWPSGINRETLAPYYGVAKSALGAKPIPCAENAPRRRMVRTELFQAFAKKEGRETKLADICVFFGNRYNYEDQAHAPTQIGIQERNRYGAIQTSCTYCGECDVGCNTHSKNSVDLNYLYVAEHVHRATIRTEALAEQIVPLGKYGEPDVEADGRHGYRICFRRGEGGAEFFAHARRVIVSAGTLGTNELLLRCRDVHKTLPNISRQLGRRFSGNGDFLSFAAAGEKDADPNYGPVITQYTDYNLFHEHDPSRAFILEDASYPVFLAWFVEGMQPMLSPLRILKKLWRTVKWLWRRLTRKGKWSGSVADLFHEILGGDMSSRSSVLLCMGLDKADGVLSLKNGYLDIGWPQTTNMPLYRAILACAERFGEFVRAGLVTALPTWDWPLRSNITVHPLGGCALAASPEEGVVSAGKNRGEVFGYRGLYVADGSILPGAVGANPVATISALAEWIAEGITHSAPDADLGCAQTSEDNNRAQNTP